MPGETQAAFVTEAASLATTTSSPFLLRRLVDLDIALSLWFHTACLSVPRWFLKTLEISGDGRFWFSILISLFSISPRSPVLLYLILGSLLDLLLVGLIKHVVRRPRPVYNKDMYLTFAVDHWSFPSGHSSRVFFIAAFLNICAEPVRVVLESHRWIHVYSGGEPADLLLVFVCVWSVATSASRVLLGRHFVLDVIAGACLGLFEALLVFNLMKFSGIGKLFVSRVQAIFSSYLAR